MSDVCPHCGGDSGYVTHDYYYGWAEFAGAWDGTEDSLTFTDRLVARKSKTAVCEDCGKRVKRPEYMGGRE